MRPRLSPRPFPRSAKPTRRRTAGYIFTRIKGSYAFSEFASLTIESREEQDDGSTTTAYRLFLEGAGHRLHLETTYSYDEARKNADAIAAMVGVRVIDQGKAVTPGDYDRPVWKRSDPVREPEPPPQTAIEFRDNVFTLPATGFKAEHWIVTVVSLLFMTPVCFMAVDAFKTHLLWGASVFMVTPFWIPFLVLGSATRRERISISRNTLSVRIQTCFRKRTFEIPCDTIAEVRVDEVLSMPGSNNALIVRTPNERHDFAVGRTILELNWIRDAILRVIQSQSGV